MIGNQLRGNQLFIAVLPLLNWTKQVSTVKTKDPSMPICPNAIITAALFSLLISNGSVSAQVPPGDSSSQRILPLPDGQLSNAQTQMQLLQKLRSLVTGSQNAPQAEASSSDDPKLKDEQLEQLQNALKKLQDQLPPGIKPPDLDSIPKDQLDDAISNPAVQQQLKKMLEQFSRDGLLPETGNSDEPRTMPPMPRRRGESPPRPGSNRQTPPDADPSPAPAEESWQSLQDAMKKLSEIAQGEKQELTDDPQSDSGQNSEPDLNTDEPPQHSLQAFQDLLERYRNSQQSDRQESADDSSESRDATLPEIRPGTRSQRPESHERVPKQDASSRVLRRSDRMKPVEPPVAPGPDQAENSSERFPPAEMTPPNTPYGEENRGLPESGRRSEIGDEPDSSNGLIPSVSEFLKDQLRNGFLVPNGGQRENTERGETPPARIDHEKSESQDIDQPDQSSQTVPGNPTPDRDPPAIDIRRELESRGIRGTIEKLVQKAREESKSQQRTQQKSVSGGTDAGQLESPSSPSGNEAVSNAPRSGTNDAGLQKSLRDLLGGLDIEMGDVIKDARFRAPETQSAPQRDSARQTAPNDSKSQLKTWNDAASQFFSDLSKAPEAPPSEQTSAVDDTSAGSPPASGSWFIAALGLLGLLAVIAFCIRRPLLKIVSDVTGFAVSNGRRTPGEIKSRADIISAFHELVLNPRQLVEAWWTHRAAAQKLAADSPQQEHAVRTLAEIYEQARYLPDDVELPAESMQTARAAFLECQL